MLELKNVTLVCYEVKAHALASRVIAELMRHIRFADVHVWSDQPLPERELWAQPVTYFALPQNASRLEAHYTLWHEIPAEIETSHFLNVEWDSGLNDPSMWSDEFLAFDYIGALWPWHAERRVGNGGFSLRSKRLGEFLFANASRFPPFSPEDDILCRAYRQFLEHEGFVWSPPDVAQRFSFERETPRRTFGFHGVWNWPVLGLERCIKRMRLANDYVRSKPEWAELRVPMLSGPEVPPQDVVRGALNV